MSSIVIIDAILFVVFIYYIIGMVSVGKKIDRKLKEKQKNKIV